jgi:hypothetical protein
MRPIGLACACAVLAVTLAPGRLSAAEPDWKAANSAYAAAREAAKKARPPSDYALCAGNWSAWDDALYDGKVMDATLTTLDPDLRIDGADEKVNLWRLWLGDSDKAYDAFDQHRADAGAKIDQAMGGDKDALMAIMGTLGACQLPKDK